MSKKNLGFLRETAEAAKKSGIDKYSGLCRTGLEEYLKYIFPNINDWVHDKTIPNIERKIRPDYRSESLKLIIEFDGLPHYQKPDIIQSDKEKDIFYRSLGYKVVRIPYFIQLTNKTIFKMFGVNLKEEMFPKNVASLRIESKNTPAFLCPSGIERMKNELKEYPEQYEINVNFLLKQNNEFLTGVKFLLDKTEK